MKSKDFLVSSAPEGEVFKNATGAWLLKALFYETATDPDKTHVLYSFKPEDHEVNGVVYPSLRRLYLEMEDDTEYYFAQAYFGGWPHWKRLLSCSWFVDYITEIREEQIGRASCRERVQISVVADSSTKNRLQRDTAHERA